MKICMFSLLLFAHVIAFAQQYQLTTRHITMEDGLPNDNVPDIFQDKEGFIWISTNYGFCRFDGYGTDVHYQQVYSAIGGAKYNSINNILQDKAGRLWINYSYQTDWIENPSRIVEIHHPYQQTTASFDEVFGKQAPFTMSQIVFLTGADDATVWIVTHRGEVYKFDGAFHKIATLPTSDIKISSSNRLQKASAHTFWLLDNNQKLLYEVPENGKVEHISIPDSVTHIWTDEKAYLQLAPYEKPEIWIKPPSKPLHIQKTPLHNRNTFTITLTDKANRHWCIRADSIHIFGANGQLLSSGSNDVVPNEVPRRTIYAPFFDRSGQLWLGTNQGISIFSLSQSPFRNYLTEYGIQDIRGIIADKNDAIYVNQDFIYKITNDEVRQLPCSRVPLIGGLKDGSIIWAGLYDVKLFKYDLVTQQTSFVYLDTIKFNKKAYPLVLHHSPKTGRIWVGGYLLLGYLNAAKNKVVYYDKYNSFSNIKNRIIQFFYENKEGIWLCTDKGLYLLDEQKGIIAQAEAPLLQSNIVHLYEDKAGIFWLATRGKGLLRWDRKLQRVQSFTQEEGLTNDVIYAVYEDDYNNLWLPSNYGLMRFDKNTHAIRNFLPKNGIPHHEFNYTSHASAPDGRLFFGGLGGVTSFHPKDFVNSIGNDAPLRVIHFEKLDAPTGILKDFTKEILLQNRIRMRPGERSFNLALALLNYQNSKQNRYAYRVEGLEKEWKFIVGNTLQVGGLPYGNFILHIKAQDVNGVWAKQELRIPLWVVRPFYLRTWFILLAILALALLIWRFFRWRTTQLIKEKQHLELEVSRRTATIEQQATELRAMDEQKSRFFLNITHDLRTPLTFIATPIALFLKEESLNEPVKSFLQSIQRNANHLLGLIDSILDLSKLNAQPLVLEETKVNLYELIQYTFSMYDSYAKMHNLEYSIDYQSNRNLHLLLDKNKFEKILNNLLANALKYNVKNGKVHLLVEEQADTMQIQVVDTGIGIHPDDLPHIFKRYYQSHQSNTLIQGGSGIGLAIAWEYSKIMGRTKQVMLGKKERLN